jgi:hypothetical protein
MEYMQPFLWTLASLVAYIVGLVLIVKVTSRLLFCSYDDVRFLGFAMLDVFGALLVFGSIALSLFVYNVTIPIRTLNFILLVVVILVTGRTALSCFRAYRQGVQPLSRYGAGIFCLSLSLAAIYCIIQLFTPVL